jgi:hypothetical protein
MEKMTPTKGIMNKLEQAGYRTFLNTDSDVKKIETSLLNASCMILCITQTFSVDEFCRFEAAEAIKLNKPIIPVILKDRMVLDQEKEWLLEMIIPNQPYVWFDDGLNEEGFERMFERIKRLTPLTAPITASNNSKMPFKAILFDRSQALFKNEIEKLKIQKRKCTNIVLNVKDSSQ